MATKAANVTDIEVESTLKRIQTHKGVLGYSTFQNACFVSGILRESVDIEYRKIQTAKTLSKTRDCRKWRKYMRGFRVFENFF